MRVLALAAAAVLISSPTWAAEVTFNGLVTGLQNQTNQRIDAFQAANHNQIPAPVNQQIDMAQGTFNASFATIKADNPFGNTTVPAGFPTFTIPALPVLPH